MAKAAQRVEAAFQIGASGKRAAQLRFELARFAPRPREVGANQRVEHVGMANEDRGEVAARSEQPQQHAAGARMLFQQRQKRGPRPDRCDERDEVLHREVGIGQAAHLVEQARAEAIDQLAPARTRRSARRSGREQRQMARAFLRRRKAERLERQAGLFGIRRRLPGGDRRGGSNRCGAGRSARQQLVEQFGDAQAMTPERGLKVRRSLFALAESHPGGQRANAGLADRETYESAVRRRLAACAPRRAETGTLRPSRPRGLNPGSRGNRAA